MKFVLMLSLVLSSMAANAISPASTWEQIFNSPASVEVEYRYSQVLAPFKLNNVCLTDTSVQTIRPVSICEKYEKVVTTTRGKGGGVSTSYKCVEKAAKILSRSRDFFSYHCVAYNTPHHRDEARECIEYAKVAEYVPAAIFAKVSIARGKNVIDFKKRFTFPVCE